MNIKSNLVFSQPLPLCPRCQSEHLEAIEENELCCQACGKTFKLPKSSDTLRQIASLFTDQAREEMEKEEGDLKKAFHDLESARKLLQTVLKRKHNLANTRFQLGLVYYELGDFHKFHQPKPKYKKALACYLKAIDYLEKSHDPDNQEGILLLCGLLHDRAAFTAYTLENEKIEMIITQMEKAVISFQDYIDLISEKEDAEEEWLDGMQALARNHWMLGEAYRDLEDYPSAINHQKELLLVLEPLYEHIPALENIAKAGLASAHHEIAWLIDHLDVQEKEARKEEQHVHQRQSEHYYYSLTQKDQSAYLRWLGFSEAVDKQKERDELSETIDKRLDSLTEKLEESSQIMKDLKASIAQVDQEIEQIDQALDEELDEQDYKKLEEQLIALQERMEKNSQISEMIDREMENVEKEIVLAKKEVKEFVRLVDEDQAEPDSAELDNDELDSEALDREQEEDTESISALSAKSSTLFADQSDLASLFNTEEEWEQLSEEQKADLFEKRMGDFEEDLRHYLSFATESEARIMAEDLLLELEKNDQLREPDQSAETTALFTMQMAYLFNEKGFLDLYAQFGDLSIGYFERELSRDLERERADMLRECEAKICYDLGSVHPDRERGFALLDLAFERLEEIEDKESLLSPELYGEVMFLKSVEFKYSKEYSRAQKYARIARKYLGEKRFKDLQRRFTF